MSKSNQKKTIQLGMPVGTASHKLRKLILFTLLRQCNKDTCHRCDETIETIEELSIEHVTAWLDSKAPKELFFDLKNIAFSHLKCNISTAKKPHKGKILKHPGVNAYDKGCRCSDCKRLKREKQKRYRNRCRNPATGFIN